MEETKILVVDDNPEIREVLRVPVSYTHLDVYKRQGLPIGLIAGFSVSWLVLPSVMKFFSYTALNTTEVSVSPLIFVIASLFTILTVFISTQKPAKKAAKVSPLEAIRYTGQENFKKKAIKRTQGAKPVSYTHLLERDIDMLTGLYNRRAFYNKMDALFPVSYTHL